MVDEILKVLVNLKNNLNSLLETLSAKQRALISLNYEELEKSIISEEKSLTAIRECELARTNAFDKFYSEKSVERLSYKVSDLCEKFPGISNSNLIKLRNLEAQIKETIGNIDHINHQNLYIIEHSRTFIKETISSLISANKSFLDRRV